MQLLFYSILTSILFVYDKLEKVYRLQEDRKRLVAVDINLNIHEIVLCSASMYICRQNIVISMIKLKVLAKLYFREQVVSLIFGHIFAKIRLVSR